MIKEIVILKPKKPLNFSESCNLGVKESSNETIFFLNDDTIISKGCVEELVDKLDDNTITGPDSNCNLGFQTDYAYVVKDISLIPSMTIPQVKDIIPDIYNIKPMKEDVVSREWLAFFAVMMTRKCFNDVGFLDETFVYDREDLDWCIRAKNLNKKFSQVFSSYCFHFGGASRKKKHKELGLKHDLNTEHNELYFKTKYNVQDKPIIAFYCNDAWEYWDEKSLNSSLTDQKPSGIGGSETQVIHLSREFSKLGYKVKVFNKCRENHMDSGYDVEYIPFQDFQSYSKKVKYNYFIAERYLNCFDKSFEYDRAFAMIHDVFLIMGNRKRTDVELDKIEKYFCLSNRHMKFVNEYHRIPFDKLLMTSNGLDLARFKGQNVVRDPNRMVYSSSPDRGLEVLLPVFDKIKKMHPATELHIYYGFENFHNKIFVEKMLQEIEKREGVFYHGRVGQDELAREFLKSGILSYLCAFEETFCITALEAMAAGAVVLSSDYWAMPDTVKDGGILISTNDDKNNVLTKEYQNAYISQAYRLLKDEKYAESWRHKGYLRASKFTWEAVAKQWHTYFTEGTWEEISK